MATRNIHLSLLMIGLGFSLLANAPLAKAQDESAIVKANEASTQTCSLQTLAGTYGYLALGSVAGSPEPPILAVISGRITFDGAGNHLGESTTNFNGWFTEAEDFTGTQIVNPDCSFSGQHVSTATGDITHFVGTIAGRGMSKEVRFIVTDPGVVAYGTDRPISPGCSLSSLKGAYEFASQGTITANTPSSLFARVGILTADGQGNFAGSSTIALNGTTVPETLTGTYTVDANCTLSLEINSSVFGVIHELGRITREGQSQEVTLIITDHGYVMAETMRRQ